MRSLMFHKLPTFKGGEDASASEGVEEDEENEADLWDDHATRQRAPRKPRLFTVAKLI